VKNHVKFKHLFTCIVGGRLVVKKRPSSSNSCITSSPCVQSHAWMAELFGVTVKRQRYLASNSKYHIRKGYLNRTATSRGEPSLIILDDLLNEAYVRDVCDLCTKGSHNRNISVVLLTQNIFHQNYVFP